MNGDKNAVQHSRIGVNMRWNKKKGCIN